MRIFVAGAAGVIGRALVPRLVASGHDVTGTTRTDEKRQLLESFGAESVVVDALDRRALEEAVVAARPEVVVHELTDLRRAFGRSSFAANNRLRREGTKNLVAAARAAGARRVVAQSIAFAYAPAPGLAREGDDLYVDAPDPLGDNVRAVAELEAEVLGAETADGIVLRYGWFYGPETSYARDGSTAEQVRRRRFPVVGSGRGVFSFVHVDDAADATVRALDAPAGTYNVVDDEPAELRHWLPEYARALGAPAPRRVPSLVARLAAGKYAVEIATRNRGAANEKAKRELAWQPRPRDWAEAL